MRNTFRIHFHIWNQKTVNGKTPIYVRITINGQRTEISTRQLINSHDWDSTTGYMKGKLLQATEINSFIDSFRSLIISQYNELFFSGKQITIPLLKNKILGNYENNILLLKLFDIHLKDTKYSISISTIRNFNTTIKYVALYIKKEYKINDIPLSMLNLQFLTGFDRFVKENPLSSRIPCGNNTAIKHIGRIRKIINYALKNDWIEKDPFAKYKAAIIKKEREYLTETELQSLVLKNFEIQNIELVKDTFIFSCFTGLAFSDLFNLTTQNIRIGLDGGFWIETCRKKTDQLVKIPILPQALQIIEKYKYNPIAVKRGFLFPKIRNCSANYYLKEIADICGIKKTLTFHMARHTFATTVTLMNGVPIETVSKLLGHTSIKTTQIYARVVETKITNDMNMLKQKLENKNYLIAK